MQKSSSSRRLKALCEGAVIVALAQILGYIKLYRMPYGGSITFSMLPIFIYCVRWGFGPGIMASFVFSCLQFMLDGGFSISWISIIGDYVLAYTVLGFAGIFKGRKNGLYIGSVAGGLARFLVTYVVGATVWAEYMPDEFFGMTMTTPWFYSAIYNGFYIGVSILVCIVVEALLVKPLKKYITGSDMAGD